MSVARPVSGGRGRCGVTAILLVAEDNESYFPGCAGESPLHRHVKGEHLTPQQVHTTGATQVWSWKTSTTRAFFQYTRCTATRCRVLSGSAK